MKRNQLIAKWRKETADYSSDDKTRSLTGRKDGRALKDAEKWSETTRTRKVEAGRSQNKSQNSTQKGLSQTKESDIQSRTQKGQSREAECRSTSQESGSSTQDNTKETTAEIEIPGFYYDVEKKKYFKIQPSHGGNTTSTVTREGIERKAKEKHRLNEMFRSTSCIKAKISTAKPQMHSDLPHLLNSRCSGAMSANMLDRLFMFKRISNLRSTPLCSQGLISRTHPAYYRIEHMQNLEVSENQDCILGIWSREEMICNMVQLMNVKKAKRTNEKHGLFVNIDVPDQSSLVLWNKVTNVCWADLQRDKNVQHILFTTTSLNCAGDDDESMAWIRQMSTSPDQTPKDLAFHLGHKCTWTCAWNTHGQNFSVGGEQCALLIDTETRRMWELHTNKSDPLTQIFDPKTRHCLYSGTRKKQILSHDLRSISTRATTTLVQSCSVCSLRLLQDQSKLLASDVRGEVCLWDLRMRRVVQQYSGLKNQYRCIPIHVDETERLVYGADSDGYIRFWSLQTGELLRTIPPPSSLAQDFIPTVAYSERWGGEQGTAGMLMGLGSKIYLYPSISVDVGTDYQECEDLASSIYL